MSEADRNNPPAPPPPPGVEVAPRVFVPEAALRFQFARSSGPGGQNVNKVNTKAELWVPLTALTDLHEDALARLRDMAGRRLTKAGEIHIVAETERTQESNRAAVLERLRVLLVAAMHRPKARRKTKPSRASRQRRLDAKKHRGDVKAKRRARAD